MFKLIFRFSRFTHKYLGLIALVYFLGMGVSGILLNHPTLLQEFSLPCEIRQHRLPCLRKSIKKATSPYGTFFLNSITAVFFETFSAVTPGS